MMIYTNKMKRDGVHPVIKSNINARRIATTAMATVLAVSAGLGLTGCFGIGGSSSSSSSSSGKTSVNSNTAKMVSSSTKIQMKKGAENKMFNNSITLSILDFQRRPVSLFQGSSKQSSDSTGRSSGTVGTTSTTDVALQIDFSYVWNPNTYATNTTNAGGTNTNTPSSLEDVLQPGKLMYIQGKDQYGELYTSSTIITPDTTEDNTLSLNQQWDYNLIKSDLPQASDTKKGSVVFQVSTSVTDLELIIITPDNNSNPTQADNVLAGNNKIYSLSLT